MSKIWLFITLNHYRPQYCFYVTTAICYPQKTTFRVQVLYRAGALAVR